MSGVAWAAPGLQAQAADMPTKAPAAAPVPYWWFHGSAEIGYRDFLNDPQNGYMTSNHPPGNFPGVAGNSLAKYYEYSDVKPGIFGNVWLSAGTSDGLYQFDLGGKNIGYNDQMFWFDGSKAGEFYFNFGWDQSPHLYSTSAYTPFNVNGGAVTLNSCVTTGGAKTTALLLAPCATPTDIGIKRDTASADGRWTPGDGAWDIRTDYSHMARTGTQVGMMFGGVSPTTQYPKPVDDVTQNYGVNAEYAGTSPWGQRLVVKMGYVGSTYTDNISAITVQSTNFATTQPFGARMANWPSNNANGFTGSVAADLPWKSRYVGTVNYTMMRQDDAFLPNNSNPANQTALPAASLSGAINTLLINNQLTTKLASDLTSKLTYRYYDFENNTPELLFINDPNRDYSAGSEWVRSLSMGYIKQNAGAGLNWRPTKELNVGADYGFERHDWTRVDVNATNENSGKVYADWKPVSWAMLRASGFYGVRRYDTYDYQGNVGFFQWTCPGATCDASELYATSYRQLMFSNRDTYKANLSADLSVIQNVTVTPFAKYVEANYQVDPGQQGLKNNRKWSAGADVTFMVNRDTSIMVGYMYEWGSQLMWGINCTESSTAGAQCAGGQIVTNDTTTVQTFTAGARIDVIPDKLDTDFRYTLSNGIDNLNMFGSGANFGANGISTQGGQFPVNRTWFQRFDATATYKFDKEQVAAMGWKGEVKAKLHYTWERNAEDNWANDPLTPYNLVNSNLWLGWDNPNYNVHMLSASINFAW